MSMPDSATEAVKRLLKAHERAAGFWWWSRCSRTYRFVWADLVGAIRHASQWLEHGKKTLVEQTLLTAALENAEDLASRCKPYTWWGK